MAVFKRNLTSKLIEKSVIKLISNENGKEIVELGCGDGNISRSLVSSNSQNRYYASDISVEAISAAKLCDQDRRIDFRVGALFKPWENMKFDLIISDVASLSSEIATRSEWYDGVSCATGVNGLEVVRDVIFQARDYMRPYAKFVIPIISLSDHVAQRQLLKRTFPEIRYELRTVWPLPVEITRRLTADDLPITCSNWEIKEQYGIYTAYTEVAICSFSAR